MKNLKALLAIVIVVLSLFLFSCQKAANASFTYTQNGTRTINFANTSSGASSYDWDFGDGTKSILTSPTHTYSNFGTYTVILTANSLNGNGVNVQDIHTQ